MKENIGETSDGYHTFNELYEHRHTLYIALCKSYKSKAWRATKHSDGTSYDGWFILGLCKEQGKQITYHLPMSKWGECDNWCETLSKSPEWDKHTSKDVLERIKLLN
jgi:hypothetical protein